METALCCLGLLFWKAGVQLSHTAYTAGPGTSAHRLDYVSVGAISWLCSQTLANGQFTGLSKANSLRPAMSAPHCTPIQPLNMDGHVLDLGLFPSKASSWVSVATGLSSLTLFLLLLLLVPFFLSQSPPAHSHGGSSLVQCLGFLQ